MEIKSNIEKKLEIASNCALEAISENDKNNANKVLENGRQTYCLKLLELGLIEEEKKIPNFKLKRKRKLLLASSLGLFYFSIILIPLVRDILRGQSTYISLVVYLAAVSIYSFLIWNNFFKSPVLQLNKMIIASNKNIKKQLRKNNY